VSLKSERIYYKLFKNILFRIAKAYGCFGQPSETLLGKCAMFLKVEVVRNYSILANFQKEDFDLFKVRK
jgi:hypothetical protein